eukprot:TRINITY_DN17489_c0_g1_i1.p1 TRINITY_DN17489_c0_g1~~TRINITY_DN17489_c0_g1_i1.p1  ORF type:complete len:224 (-),score=49.18 TRINITY_DN17489_c0_g1_i1:88-759(-)
MAQHLGEDSSDEVQVDLCDQILHDYENPEHIGNLKRVPPKPNDLRRLETRAVAVFGDSPAAAKKPLRRANSSPQLKPTDSSTLSAKTTSGSLYKFQRGFGVSLRPAIYVGANNALGPGQYDTHNVGGMVWEKDAAVSHPAQKQLSSHKSPPLASMGKPKSLSTSKAKIAMHPGPGYYMPPNTWDPCWQRFPPAGKSFDRKVAVQGESRFGGLASRMIGANAEN